MAAEVMVCTPAIRALIRENKVHEMYGVLQVSQKYGMLTMNMSLLDLVTTGQVTAERAHERLQSARGTGTHAGESRAGYRGQADRPRTLAGRP